MKNIPSNANRVKGIARHLTGSQLQDMAKAYSKGFSIHSPKGVYVSRPDFEFLCSYLKTSPERLVA